MFHLKEFKNALTDLGIECKLVIDIDICQGFPSRKISDWFQTRKKFEQLISEFKPNVILVDRQRHFSLIASKYDIPLIIHLRGDYWSEIKWAKDTLYSSFLKRIVLQKWVSMAEQTFQKSFLIIPICKYLDNIVKQYYPEKKTYVLHGGITPSRWYPSKGMTLK
ncbi:MAG: glycosyltransferase family 1 protein, partial [Nitrosarchaeum sp.]